ncbi:MAG TPA: MATE family efflux transporter [Thermoplasmata archaeon]|nr:MATE family efflux transporter [Thermoplasmata archaeon]
MDAAPESPRRLRRTLLDLAWPVIIANFLQVLATTVDIIMVGRIGIADIAAVGTGANLVFFATTIIIGITSGTIALVARAIGEQRPRHAEHFLFQSLIAGGLLSIPMVVVGVAFAPWIVAPFSPTPEVRALAADYTSIIFLSMPSLFTIFVGTAALRAAGDSRTPMIIGVIENVINFGINYTLIFGNFGFPALGVRGAAIGTSIAYFTGAVLFIGLFVDHRLKIGIDRERPFVNVRTIKRILRIGLPAATEQFLFQVGILIWIVFVVSFGEAAVAAHQIGLRIQSFAFMPGLGLSIASSALTGQNLGAKLPERAERSAREATKMSIAVMSAIAAFNFVFAPWIALAFAPPGEAVDLAVLFIRLHALSIPAVGFFFTLSGSLRGAGDTRWPLYASVIGTYGVRLPLSALLGFVLGWGLFGVWVALPIEYYLRSLIIMNRFNGGAWKATAV